LPNDYIKISFEKDSCNEDARILTIHTYGNKYDFLAEE
jgi:hypothetical protein